MVGWATCCPRVCIYFLRGASRSTSPGAARRPVTFLVSPRKVTKRRRPPVRRSCGLPCAARRAGRLRNSPSRKAARAQTVLADFPRHDCAARRLSGGGKAVSRSFSGTEHEKVTSCRATPGQLSSEFAMAYKFIAGRIVVAVLAAVSATDAAHAQNYPKIGRAHV